MSTDSDSAATPPGTGPSPEPGAESADPPRLKRRFKREAGGPADPEEGSSDQAIQLLNSLLQNMVAKKDLPAAPAVDGDVKATKYHRLSKTGSGAPAATEGAPEAPEGISNRPAGESFRAAASTPVASSGPSPFDPYFQNQRLRRLRVWYFLFALLLAGAAYLIGTRYPPPGWGAHGEVKAELPPVAPAAWTDAMLRQLDQAFAADRAGDLSGADRIASAMRDPKNPLPALDLYLATLRTRQNHFFDVEADLLREVTDAPPLLAADLNEKLAFNFSRNRDFEKASQYFEAAARGNPLSAALFYHWGEALRHRGHFQEAITRFRGALDRVPAGQPETASLQECIELKMGLAMLEFGPAPELQTGIAEHLKAAAPSGYWLLLAAASDLQKNDLAGATALLGRARDTLGEPQFGALLNDYFFRAYADRVELAAFFPADTPARQQKLRASMTYSIEP